MAPGGDSAGAGGQELPWRWGAVCAKALGAPSRVAHRAGSLGACGRDACPTGGGQVMVRGT